MAQLCTVPHDLHVMRLKSCCSQHDWSSSGYQHDPSKHLLGAASEAPEAMVQSAQPCCSWSCATSVSAASSVPEPAASTAASRISAAPCKQSAFEAHLPAINPADHVSLLDSICEWLPSRRVRYLSHVGL